MSDLSSGAPSGRRILIVGEPSLGGGLMRLVLGRLDYLVTCVATGAAAMQALLQDRFAVALVALELPDMAGIALARRLQHGACPGPRPGLVLFGSAWDQDATQRQCREAGLDAFLQKPISIARLVATVRRLTRRTGPDRPMESVMSNGAPPLDLDHLASFTEGDAQLERELCALFLATAALHVSDLSRALEQGRDWSATAHGLKGASAGIGARMLAGLAERAEHAGPSSQALRDIVAGLDEVRAFVEHRQQSDLRPSPDPPP